VSGHILRVQDALGRAILVENPSSYLRFQDSPIPEPAFLAELARRTGCRVLCDVNNIYVSCRNFGLDPATWVDAMPGSAVAEIHLAGHSVNDADGQAILIDDHGSRVAEPVWALYERLLARIGAAPTLVEWDTDIPALPVLLAEAQSAARRLAEAAPGARATFKGHDAHAA